ncbi:MAG: hypothetical protein HQK88_01935 [Nitrospirae bacterium]|nr:hypothetical protein [Nitrospirota bacterium]MBF0533734.1 hypothetical protein [Nitrospirota bacterium]MBF0615557.1 hypothetical protein [Nitrospirota bacterium]
MKRRFIYFLALVLLLTGVAVNQTGKNVIASDNVSYIMPFLHTNTGNVIYCVASNMSSDNATISVTVMSNPTGFTPAWRPVTVTTVNARKTTMLTFSGTSVIAGTSAAADISSDVASGANAYAAIVNFAGANSATTTGAVWYMNGPMSACTHIGLNDCYMSNSGYSPKYTFGRSNRLINGTYYDVYNGQTTVPLTCQTLTMSCFQGSTTPKRNLVGYMCMDTLNSMYPPLSY